MTGILVSAIFVYVTHIILFTAMTSVGCSFSTVLLCVFGYD